MNANERDEIAASVAAHADLGPRYDTAVAEGLVERIGDEIDKRIDAKLGGHAPQPARSGHVPPGYAWPSVPAPARPAVPPPPPVPAHPAPAPAPSRASGLSGMVLGLGSMGLGVGATSVVVSHHPESVAGVLMVLLIWLAIAVINIAHSRRR